MLSGNLQTGLHLIFPPRCVGCGQEVGDDFALCPSCWGDTPFLTGLCCHSCGAPVLGEVEDDTIVRCDRCMRRPPPWSMGRAVMRYDALARKMILGLKHGERHDVARAAAFWMATAAAPMLESDTIIAPIPLHWQRFLKRRYNQSAILGQAVARKLGVAYAPDSLLRPKTSGSLEGLNAKERKAKMKGAIIPHPKRGDRLAGKSVLLIDDVLTTGSTLRAATQACFAVGARDVRVLVLARVAKDP